MRQYITVIPALKLGQFRGGRSTRLGGEGERAITRFYSYGRDAIWAGLELLGIKQADEVLVPAVMCSEVLAVFARRGVNVHYYRLDTAFQFF